MNNNGAPQERQKKAFRRLPKKEKYLGIIKPSHPWHFPLLVQSIHKSIKSAVPSKFPATHQAEGLHSPRRELLPEGQRLPQEVRCGGQPEGGTFSTVLQSGVLRWVPRELVTLMARVPSEVRPLHNICDLRMI